MIWGEWVGTEAGVSERQKWGAVGSVGWRVPGKERQTQVPPPEENTARTPPRPGSRPVREIHPSIHLFLY